MKEYISRKDAAQYLKVDEQTISNYITRGLLSYRKIDRLVYVLRDDVEKYSEKIQEYIADGKELESLIAQQKQEIADMKKKIQRIRESACLSYDLLDEAVDLFTTVMQLYKDKFLDKREAEIVQKTFLSCVNVSMDELAKEYWMSKVRVRRILAASIITVKEGLVEYNMNTEYNTERLEKENAELRAKAISNRLHGTDLPIRGYGFVSDIFSTKLIDCDLSVRVLHCMKLADIETVADLLLWDKKDLLKFRGFSTKSLIELDDFLETLGLRFGMRPDEIFKTFNYKNIPERIYLHTGVEDVDATHDFNEMSEVTWSSDRVFDSDIEYIKLSKAPLL